MSEHFKPSEFACHHCGAIVVRPKLVACLEHLRAMRGRPIRIIDGYRCPVHNRAVGGAPNSQHLYGAAVDFSAGTCTMNEAVRAGFVGIGTKNGQPVHVDVRDGLPARWTY